MILPEEPAVAGRSAGQGSGRSQGRGRGHGHGRAALRVESVAGCSAATGIEATSPLKLLVPVTRGPSVWAYTSSFGGGMVAGDQTRLEVQLAAGTRCFLGTQASTKVYRNPEQRPCCHSTRAEVGSGALLVFAPDPVQAFAQSSYVQRQEFHLASEASLVLVDWFSSGRAARGERWEFNRFESRNEVWSGPKLLSVVAQTSESAVSPVSKPANGAPSTADSLPQRSAAESTELVFLDSLRLSAEDGSLSAPHRTGRFNCFATLLLLGPAVSARAAEILAEIKQAPVSRQAPLLASASPVRDGVVLRLAGESVETVGRELHRHLAPLSAFLGDDPWARKW